MSNVTEKIDKLLDEGKEDVLFKTMSEKVDKNLSKVISEIAKNLNQAEKMGMITKKHIGNVLKAAQDLSDSYSTVLMFFAKQR